MTRRREGCWHSGVWLSGLGGDAGVEGVPGGLGVSQKLSPRLNVL